MFPLPMLATIPDDLDRIEYVRRLLDMEFHHDTIQLSLCISLPLGLYKGGFIEPSPR
jgi:hypothetical protein